MGETGGGRTRTAYYFRLDAPRGEMMTGPLFHIRDVTQFLGVIFRLPEKLQPVSHRCLVLERQ